MYNPFEDMALRLARLELLLTEFRQDLSMLQPKFPMNERIGGLELAIQITGLTKHTLYQLTRKNRIPYMRRGKKLYFSNLELLAWLKSGRNMPESDTVCLSSDGS